MKTKFDVFLNNVKQLRISVSKKNRKYGTRLAIFMNYSYYLSMRRAVLRIEKQTEDHERFIKCLTVFEYKINLVYNQEFPPYVIFDKETALLWG